MGCGKGGDLTKWAKARIKELLAVGAYLLSSALLSFVFMVRLEKILLRYQWIKHVNVGTHPKAIDSMHRSPLSIVMWNRYREHFRLRN